jgi:hypothetical protein
MKRCIFVTLMMVTLAGQGCLGVDKPFWEHQQVDVKEPHPAPLLPPPPVTPDLIDEANAAQKLDALAAELTRDETEPVVQPAPPRQKP